jgi:hypothetical protein
MFKSKIERHGNVTGSSLDLGYDIRKAQRREGPLERKEEAQDGDGMEHVTRQLSPLFFFSFTVNRREII